MGGPLLLRIPKLQKRASVPEGTKMGFPKIAPPNFFGFGVTCQWAQYGGCKKHPPPFVLLRGQLPIVKAYLGGGQKLNLFFSFMV